MINSVDKFNYRLDNDEVVTATIWADSVQVTGNDSVFFLNRIMCDTCVTIVGGPNPCDTCYAAKNRPQFFQRQVSVLSNGVVNLRDTGNIVIKTLANLNDSWLFDSIQNISATVIAVGMDSVLGNYDSLKTILLTSGDTIKIFQNFGVGQYPYHYGLNSYYRLVGIEGRGVGEQVPKFADFFDFDVGDMFEFHRNTASGGTCLISESVHKFTVASKMMYPDSITYNIQGYYSLHEHWDVGFPCQNFSNHTYGIISSIITFKDSAGHFANAYNNTVINKNNIFNSFYGTSYPIYGVFLPTECGPVILLVDSNNKMSKSFFQHTDYFTYNTISYYPIDSSYSDTLNPCFACASDLTGTLTAGLGQTSYLFNTGFYLEKEFLAAYRKGIDTVGEFTPDSFFTSGFDENTFTDQFVIYPNPSTSFLNISFPIQTKAEISFADLQGKILKHKLISTEKVEIDVSQIENGLYFLLIKTIDGIFSKKIIVLH